jgi:hypothetical protein
VVICSHGPNLASSPGPVDAAVRAAFIRPSRWPGNCRASMTSPSSGRTCSLGAADRNKPAPKGQIIRWATAKYCSAASSSSTAGSGDPRDRSGPPPPESPRRMGCSSACSAGRSRSGATARIRRVRCQVALFCYVVAFLSPISHLCETRHHSYERRIMGSPCFAAESRCAWISRLCQTLPTPERGSSDAVAAVGRYSDDIC